MIPAPRILSHGYNNQSVSHIACDLHWSICLACGKANPGEASVTSKLQRAQTRRQKPRRGQHRLRPFTQPASHAAQCVPPRLDPCRHRTRVAVINERHGSSVGARQTQRLPYRSLVAMARIVGSARMFTLTALDVALDIRDGQHASRHGSFDCLRHQLLVTDGLSAFQDAHHGRLTLEVTVLGNTLMRLLVLLYSLLELDLVDLHTVFGMPEGSVDGESVRGRNVASFGMFHEWSQFGAGK
nr:hypothetical protein CFP56_02583 [Quercus suber]